MPETRSYPRLPVCWFQITPKPQGNALACTTRLDFEKRPKKKERRWKCFLRLLPNSLLPPQAKAPSSVLLVASVDILMRKDAVAFLLLLHGAVQSRMVPTKFKSHNTQKTIAHGATNDRIAAHVETPTGNACLRIVVSEAISLRYHTESRPHLRVIHDFERCKKLDSQSASRAHAYALDKFTLQLPIMTFRRCCLRITKWKCGKFKPGLTCMVYGNGIKIVRSVAWNNRMTIRIGE